MSASGPAELTVTSLSGYDTGEHGFNAIDLDWSGSKLINASVIPFHMDIRSGDKQFRQDDPIFNDVTSKWVEQFSV